MGRGAPRDDISSQHLTQGEMNMHKDIRKRAKIPFQAIQEITIPPNAVCGSGSVSDSILEYLYALLNGQPSTDVDPIQVGPTG